MITTLLDELTLWSKVFVVQNGGATRKMDQD